MALTGCTPKPPPYESRSVSPTDSASAPFQPKDATPNSQPVVASFIDEFNRPDTTSGLGDGWDLRGAPIDGSPLPPATDGYIKDRHFTYSGNSQVYAIRQFGSIVRSIGAEGKFRRNNLGAVSIFSIGTAGDSNLETNAVIFSANRNFWDLNIRLINGRFREVATGLFTPPLELGRNYQFILSEDGDTVRVTGPGLNLSKLLPVPIPPGPYGYWREYPSRAPAGEVFDCAKVWAVVDGQPAVPIETPTSGAGS